MPSDPHASRSKPVVSIGTRTRMAAAFNTLPLPRGRFDPRNTILLAGTPRSGTTWVGQILGAAEGFALVNEPLGLKMPGVERAGFSWATWQPPDADWPAGEAVLRRYFTGRGMSVKLLLRNRLGALRHRGLVIKEVKANRLLPWISRRFELRGIIHLIRHPCAVVSSQIEYFPERDPCVPDNIAYVERCLPDLLPWATALRTEWEERALTWALDQLVPMRATGERPWLTVHYETLVMDGARELERLLAALRIPPSAAIRDAHAANSWQARDRSVDHVSASAEERLGVWRRRLSTEQVHDILEVCDRCGLHLYGEANMPTAA